MRFYVLTVLGVAAVAVAQGVTSQVAPSATAPSGCLPTATGAFEIAVLGVGGDKQGDHKDKRGAACGGDGVLVATLADGVVKDAQGRTAYIASNFQFQFDAPPQAGAIYTAGFSVCGNGSLALGGSTIWYKCKSGDFYNLYDRSWAAQCTPAEIAIMPCGGGSGGGSGGDGEHGGGAETVGTIAVTTTIVSLISDGQPQVITATVPVPMCQISDGQAQVHTTPCDSVPTGPGNAPASEASDGQVQMTTGSAATPEQTGGSEGGDGSDWPGSSGATTLATTPSGSHNSPAPHTGSNPGHASTGSAATSAPTVLSGARANALVSTGSLVLGLGVAALAW